MEPFACDERSTVEEQALRHIRAECYERDACRKMRNIRLLDDVRKLSEKMDRLVCQSERLYRLKRQYKSGMTGREIHDGHNWRVLLPVSPASVSPSTCTDLTTPSELALSSTDYSEHGPASQYLPSERSAVHHGQLGTDRVDSADCVDSAARPAHAMPAEKEGACGGDCGGDCGGSSGAEDSFNARAERWRSRLLDDQLWRLSPTSQPGGSAPPHVPPSFTGLVSQHQATPAQHHSSMLTGNSLFLPQEPAGATSHHHHDDHDDDELVEPQSQTPCSPQHQQAECESAASSGRGESVAASVDRVVDTGSTPRASTSGQQQVNDAVQSSESLVSHHRDSSGDSRRKYSEAVSQHDVRRAAMVEQQDSSEQSSEQKSVSRAAPPRASALNMLRVCAHSDSESYHLSREIGANTAANDTDDDDFWGD